MVQQRFISYLAICREAAAKYGVEKIPLEQLIGLLLDCPKETAEKLAALGIKELIGLSQEELTKHKGIGKKAALKLRAILVFHEWILKYRDRERPIIKSPQDAMALVMEEMRFLDREYFKAISLTTKNQVLAIETVSVGSLNSSIVHPREVFKNPLKKSAAAIILVHNHPSGDPAPSSEDVAVTGRLVEAGKLLGVDVLDHLIIGDKKCVSLREKGLM